MNRYILVGGQVLRGVHDAGKCKGEFCTIHNNSDHHMREWPQNWREDAWIMERICPHGVGHPDPDDPNTKRYGGHGCDGCCIPPPPPDPEEVKSEIVEIERSLRD